MMTSVDADDSNFMNCMKPNQQSNQSQFQTPSLPSLEFATQQDLIKMLELLRSEFEKLTSDYNLLVAKNVDLEKKNLSLIEELSEKNERIKEQKEDIKELREEVKELKTEKKEWLSSKKSPVSSPVSPKSTPPTTPRTSVLPQKAKDCPEKEIDKNSSVFSIRYLPKEAYDQDLLRKLLEQFGKVDYIRISQDKQKEGFVFANIKILTIDGAEKAVEFLENLKTQHTLPWLEQAILIIKKEPIPRSILRISKLPDGSDSDGVKNTLSKFGRVLDVKMKVDNSFHNKKCMFATVEFEGETTAEHAKFELDKLKGEHENLQDLSCWVIPSKKK